MARRDKQSETAVLAMADLHYGKQTSSFGPAGVAGRLDAVADRLSAIKRLMSGHTFDKLVIPLLGDVNDGTDIYATQPHHQAITNVEQQAEELTDILVPFYVRLEKEWGEVEIQTVPGNHGRAGKGAHEAANWDIVAYKYLRGKLREQGSAIHVGMAQRGQNPFLRKIQIRRHNYLLYHGHDIKSFGNIPWYGMLLRAARWNLTHLAPFDVIMMGHFHTYGSWMFNRVQAKLTGTMVTDDQWALQALGWESANKWQFFGVSDRRPVTWEYAIDV